MPRPVNPNNCRRENEKFTEDIDYILWEDALRIQEDMRELDEDIRNGQDN